MSAAIPIVFMAGFDMSNTAQMENWDFTGSSWQMVTGRFGGQALEFVDSSDNTPWTVRLNRDFPGGTIPNGGGFTVGLAIRTNLQALAGFEISRLLTSAVSRVCSVFITSSGVFQILNAAGSVVATGTTIVSSGIWYHIELVGTIGSSVTLTLYVNGVQECQATSVNVGTTAAARWDLSGSASHLRTFRTLDIDDLFIGSSATQLGDQRIETLYPAVDGTDADWSTSSGTRHNDVDETGSHNSDTDYISSSTPGQRSTFTVPNLSSSPINVNAVQISIVARKDDAVTRQISTAIHKNNLDYDGNTSTGLTTGYLHYWQIYNQDPAGADWSEGDFGAGKTEFGVKEVA